MNSAGKAAALLLLTALLAGCRHRTRVTPPPEAQVPTLPVSTLADAEPPDMPPPQLPRINPPGRKTVAREQAPKPRKAIHHKPRHTTIEPTPAESTAAESAAPAQIPPEQAANGAPTDISPIGQLSAAGDSTNLPRRNQILNEIDSTQKSLDDIVKRPLSKDEQTTVTQIKTFLAKAKIALSQADLDGAHTLVTKAKVLLDEIMKS